MKLRMSQNIPEVCLNVPPPQLQKFITQDPNETPPTFFHFYKAYIMLCQKKIKRGKFGHKNVNHLNPDISILIMEIVDNFTNL